MRKTILYIFMMLGLLVAMPTTLTAYADPMDPLNQIQSVTENTTEAIGESIDRNAPVEVLDGENTEDTTDYSKSPDTDEDWEQEEKRRKSVSFMDSVLLFVGVAGVILPTLYLGIYLGARIFPSLFLPIFNFITKKEVIPDEVPAYVMFLRTVPVAVLGMLMATGWIRKIFALVWGFVENHFFK